MEPQVLAAVVTGVVSLVLAIYNVWMSRQQHRRMLVLEAARAGLARQDAAERARLDYEYEARRRLYERAEPVIFQLLNLAEDALRVIADLTDPETWDDLARTEPDPPVAVRPSLPLPGYAVVCTIYSLFAPLVVIRTLRRRVTLVDLSIEPRIELQHHLASCLYNSIQNDRAIAALEPAVPYRPFAGGWRDRRLTEPRTYWWQGLTMGRLETMLDLMTTTTPDGEGLVSFGEFETLYDDMFDDVDERRRKTVAAAANAIHCFTPRDRPVFWRLLVVQVRLYQALLRSRRADFTPPRTDQEWTDLLRLDDASSFDWRSPEYGGEPLAQVLSTVDAYLDTHVRQTWHRTR